MARIFHTSDWHVGCSLYGCDRTGDHSAVLDEIVSLAVEAKPDLIIHTGDVFDGPRPGHEHVRLALRALKELATTASTVVLAGNHDSPQLFEAFNLLLGDDAPLRFVSRGRRPEEGGIIDFSLQKERIRLAPLPFVHANRQVDWFGDSQRFMGVYAEKLSAINELLSAGLLNGSDPQRDVLVYAAHLYVEGALKSHTERPLHVTDEYAVPTGALPGVSYAALGHIHRPQAVGRSVVGRYAGSPIELDFGEEGQEKSCVLVDALPGRPPEVTVLPLSAGRRLHTLSGTLAQLGAESEGVGEGIVRVTVNSDEPIDNLADQVYELLPQAQVVEVVENVASLRLEPIDSAVAQTQAEATYEELLDEYLVAHPTKRAAANEVKALFGAFLGDRDKSDRPSGYAKLAEVLDAALPQPPKQPQHGNGPDDGNVRS